MKVKPVYLLLAVVILLLAGIFTIKAIENAAEQKALAENRTKALAENRTKAQMQCIGNLQADSDRILSQDEDVKELMNKTNNLCILRTIYNESYVEEVYRIGFNYENIDKRVYQHVGIEDFKGYQLAGGKIYTFSIDLSNETVTSIKEEQNFTLHDSVIDDVWIENTNTSVHSVTSIKGTTGVWLDRDGWLYTFKISSTGIVLPQKEPSSSEANGCLRYSVIINELFNKKQFFLNIDKNDPDAIKVWCDNDALPLIKNQGDTESLGFQVSCPQNDDKTRSYPSEAGFFYYWETIVYPDQTIMFDVNATFESVGYTKNTNEITHNWLVILSPPPSPDELSEDEIKEYGIWANDHGNYYSTNVTYVKKGDWLEAGTA